MRPWRKVKSLHNLFWKSHYKLVLNKGVVGGVEGGGGEGPHGCQCPLLLTWFTLMHVLMIHNYGSFTETWEKD